MYQNKWKRELQILINKIMLLLLTKTGFTYLWQNSYLFTNIYAKLSIYSSAGPKISVVTISPTHWQTGSWVNGVQTGEEGNILLERQSDGGTKICHLNLLKVFLDKTIDTEYFTSKFNTFWNLNLFKCRCFEKILWMI